MMITCSSHELNRIFHTLRPDITGSLNSGQLEVIHSILSGRDIFREIIRAQDRNDSDAYKLPCITPERLRTGACIRFAQRAVSNAVKNTSWKMYRSLADQDGRYFKLSGFFAEAGRKQQ
ncbi:MAG: hypothetical protein IJI75_01410 [Solobacterium sp.]|nr:hypothetical protein [Solobacterium sp.]